MNARRSPGPLRHVPRVGAAILSVFLVLIAILDSHSAASASEMSRPVSFARLVALERTTTTGPGCVDFGTSLTSCNGRVLDKFEIRRARTYTYDAVPLGCTAIDGVDQSPALRSVASKCGPRLILGSREATCRLANDGTHLLRETRTSVATKAEWTSRVRTLRRRRRARTSVRMVRSQELRGLKSLRSFGLGR